MRVQVSRIGGAIVTGLLIVALPSGGAAQLVDAAPEAAVCSAGIGLPPSVGLPQEIHARVKTMLQRSPTFRQRCRRLAAAPWLHVRVRQTVALEPRVFRARSTIKRPQPQLMIAMVELAITADPAMWLSHEFEHLIEQIDGVNMMQLGEDPFQVWQVRPGLFETRRAVRAGEAVSSEVYRKRSHDKFVD